MSIATGVAKSVRVKKEVTWGTAPGASGAQLMRRVTSNLNMAKDTFESQEMRDDYQDADYRHGMRKIEGGINGELSGGTYQMFFEAALRKLAAATADMTGLSLTVTGTTITRGSGSFITDGLRQGMVFRVTAALLAGSLNRNILVVSLSATVITYFVLDGGAVLGSEGPIAACTINVPGKRIIVPSTGHTDDSFSIEEFNTDISVSRLFTGCKVATVAVAFPATGMVTSNYTFMGKNMVVDTTAYFTSPTAATTSGILAAVNGALFISGVSVGIVTGANYDINGGMTTGAVIGSNFTPDVFEGRVKVSGQMTIYFQDATYLTAFSAESELSVLFYCTETNASNANFQAHYFPRIKLGGAAPDDGEKGLIQTVPFKVLKLATTTGQDSTTMSIQDALFV